MQAALSIEPPKGFAIDSDYLKIVGEFVNQLPGRIEEVQRAVSTRDPEALRAGLHRLASARLFGYPQLSDLIAAASGELHAGRFDEIEGLAQTLVEMQSEIVASYERALSETGE